MKFFSFINSQTTSDLPLSNSWGQGLNNAHLSYKERTIIPRNVVEIGSHLMEKIYNI